MPAGSIGKRGVISFETVQQAEHEAIDARRALHGRRPITELPAAENRKPGESMFDTTGLALSGGGIRSAAFCLGALQALGVHGLIERTDYLSTVSGGGYIGSSVSACMSQVRDTGTPTPFPFAPPGKVEDPPSVSHLRDFSNYLLPRGGKSLLDVITVILRGLGANLIFVGGMVFAAAWLTILAYPSSFDLLGGSFVPRLLDAALAWLGIGAFANNLIGARPFALTEWLFLLQLAVVIGWALCRSLVSDPASDVRSGMIAFTRFLLILLLLAAASDLQPVAVYALLSLKLWLVEKHVEPAWVTNITAAATAFAGVVTFLRGRLQSVLASTSQSPTTGALIKRIAALAIIWIAALIVPLLLWLVYLTASAAGMTGGLATGVSGHSFTQLRAWSLGTLNVPQTYFAVAAILSALSLLLSANANSLHRLYRDKLSKAFLFDPARRAQEAPDAGDLKPLDDLPLDRISPAEGGPFQLVNAAVNLQNSKSANRRGRNAGFFTFSAQHVGSKETGYARTAAAQATDPHINLGTALAVSGAAVSSNMGSNSIAALAPTLALLNVRLGYWMANPRDIREIGYFQNLYGAALGFVRRQFGAARADLASFVPLAGGIEAFVADPLRTIQRFFSGRLKLYLFAEMFGRLDETKPYVYLTDGGHIENLGLYELLHRRCRAIIVVDGEADTGMTFPSFCKLQRYARIDLGVRIDLPWQEIAERSNAITKCAENGEPIESHDGPHCAVGVITYPGGNQGLLLYVKASLSGDESDYILNYKMRNPSFPHESTGDQFFSEEQFENYRALGFHALDTFFDRTSFTWTSRGQWPDGDAPLPVRVRNHFLQQFS